MLQHASTLDRLTVSRFRCVFRYNIGPLESGKTHMYKPNCFDSESPVPTHRTFGALYANNFDKVVCNSRATMIWEAILICNVESQEKRRVAFGCLEISYYI